MNMPMDIDDCVVKHVPEPSMPSLCSTAWERRGACTGVLVGLRRCFCRLTHLRIQKRGLLIPARFCNAARNVVTYRLWSRARRLYNGALWLRKRASGVSSTIGTASKAVLAIERSSRRQFVALTGQTASSVAVVGDFNLARNVD